MVDNGHFLYETVSGDFTASGFASGDYNAQYDQVGLFLRDDADNWLKASVEVIYGSWSPDYHLSNPAHVFGVTLTTNGWSAWAPLPESPANPPGVWVRVHRQGSTYLGGGSAEVVRSGVFRVLVIGNRVGGLLSPASGYL